MGFGCNDRNNKGQTTVFCGIFQAAAVGPRAAVALIAAIPAERLAFVFRSLVWLVKLGVLRVCLDEKDSNDYNEVIAINQEALLWQS